MSKKFYLALIALLLLVFIFPCDVPAVQRILQKTSRTPNGIYYYEYYYYENENNEDNENYNYDYDEDEDEDDDDEEYFYYPEPDNTQININKNNKFKFNHNKNIYNFEPKFSPYSPGSVKQEELNKALNELNYIRRLAGVPSNVRLNFKYNDLAQHGAVLLDAVNTLTHTPGRPRDMPENFYKKGYEATSHGNISYSQYSINGQKFGNIDLCETLKGYLDDTGHNMSTLGHRRWVLNPRLKETGFGVSNRNGYSVMYVIEEGNNGKWPINSEFISWPVKNNSHPLKYFGDDVAWSVVLNREVFAKCRDKNIKVKLTRERDNKIWNFSYANHDGYFNVNHDGYAYDECIIFRPDNINYESGDSFRVEITGLTQKNNNNGKINYRVRFED